jgi:hypothetical protein
VYALAGNVIVVAARDRERGAPDDAGAVPVFEIVYGLDLRTGRLLWFRKVEAGSRPASVAEDPFTASGGTLEVGTSVKVAFPNAPSYLLDPRTGSSR